MEKTQSWNNSDANYFHAIDQSVISYPEIVSIDVLRIFDFLSHLVVSLRTQLPLQFHYRFWEHLHEEFDSPNKQDLSARIEVNM